MSELTEAIDGLGLTLQRRPLAFVWTKTADDIITRVKRGRAALDHVTESATDH